MKSDFWHKPKDGAMNFFEKIFGGFGKKKEPSYRLFESLAVGYRAPESGPGGEGEGLEISESFIRFACADRFQKGDLLDLELRYQAHYTEPRRLRVRGRVERCYRKRKQTRYRVICAFAHGVDEQFLRELRVFIDWLIAMKKNLHFRYGKEAGC